MTEPKRFNKGKHSYTRWGPNFKQVQVHGKKNKKPHPQPEEVSLSVDLDDKDALGVYSNMTLVHRSSEEVVLDFVFLPPGSKKGKVQSRVVIPIKSVGKLSKLLKKSEEEV